MRLEEFFHEIGGQKFLPSRGQYTNDLDIRDIEYDSRKITPERKGVVFACVRGDKADGHDFAEMAARAGCAAILCERELFGGKIAAEKIPQIIVGSVRSAMGEAAAVLYGRPARKMTMIGLTGTNGKTTTAYLTRSIVRSAGYEAGMTGTIVYDDGSREMEADRTTPEGPDIQRVLARMVQNGVKYCVMETSSHGLDQGRLRGCMFDRVGFSNLTFEHMEYHRDMDHYFAAKHLLFSDYVSNGWVGAVNVDDSYGFRLQSEFPGSTRGFTMGNLDSKCVKSDCYRCERLSASIDGIEFDVIYPDGEFRGVRSSMAGAYNAYNILESIVIADSLGIPRDVIHRGVAECCQVPGRLERYRLKNGAWAFVDYAHSPDSLQKTLSTLSSFKKGFLWVVWGAGGDRSKSKRPIAGEIMARLADRVIITTDNPRSENPEDIARDVESGVLSAAAGVRYEIILNREKAIRSALDSAKPDDVVLIAGKGPENYIDYGDHKTPFSDSGVVREWSAGLGPEGAER